MKTKIKGLDRINRIEVRKVPKSLLPIRVVAYTVTGGKVTAGDKFLRLAVITLMSLITGERNPRAIYYMLQTIKNQVDPRIFEVL